MLSEKLGHALDKPLARVAAHIPLHPNTLTLAGLAITIYAGCVLSQDLFRGGLLVLAGAVFDVLDGAVARVNAKQTSFGAFLDSVLDRYADSAVFAGIAAYYAQKGETGPVVLCAVALVGSLLTSYARARAEGLGAECRSGLIERPDRILLIVIGTTSGFIVPVLWALAVLSHLTTLQRIFVARKSLQGRSGKKD
ncbi:MAG: CDP-alcohol phosphatidyltransferase family protein [Thermodesulfovibrionales bacterium]